MSSSKQIPGNTPPTAALFVFLSLFLFSVLSACTGSKPDPNSLSGKIPELKGFESWPAVTNSRVEVTIELWDLCTPPPLEWEARNGPSPHRGRQISVKVNEIGRALFLDRVTTEYPEGTVIVKEKFLGPEDIEPESLGVMIKKISGWEFAYLDSGGRVSRGKEELENCYSCHAKVPKADWVFRSYLWRGDLDGGIGAKYKL